MKKNILLVFILFVSCSYPVFSQLGSPILVLPPEQSDFVSTTVTLDWQDVTDATGYLVEISTTQIFSAPIADSVNTISSQYTFQPGALLTNQTYYWRVSAHNASGFSLPSDIRRFRTAGTVSQEMGNLVTAVSTLTIPSNQRTILNNKLDHAQQKINQQHYEQAEDKLQSFEERVQDLNESGLISASAVSQLNGGADYIIAVIRTEESKGHTSGTLNTSPLVFSLDQNYPNPFNPSTTIEYSLPGNSFVSLKIYNMLGQEVSVLINKEQNAGHFITLWNAANFSSGIYYYKLTAGSFTQVKKMILTK